MGAITLPDGYLLAACSSCHVVQLLWASDVATDFYKGDLREGPFCLSCRETCLWRVLS